MISKAMPRIRISWPIIASRLELSISGTAEPMTAPRRRAARLDAVLHRFLRSRPQRDHRDHRAHADDDAQHGEERAQLVGPQRLERDHDDLAQEHRYRAPLPESTTTVSCSVKPLVTSM